MKDKTETKLPKDGSGLKKSIRYHLKYAFGKDLKSANKRELFMATSLAVRERIVDGMVNTQERYSKYQAKRLYYLSMEYLVGRSLGNNLYNLGIFEQCREALEEVGVDLEEIREVERDAALGNGGLGRLAACFLDSLATLGMPGFGYGINYDYGLFRQEIDNGYQRVSPDFWSNSETPWLFERLDEACVVPVYGRIEHDQDMEGNYNPMWLDWKVIIGIPHDMPVVGFGGHTVNYLRLFSARSSDEFDIEIFNDGDYFKAVEQKISSENISKVLYPRDSFSAGRELRLVQEYFLVACAVHDIIRHFRANYNDFKLFPEKVAIHLNDTHPALTVAELMRVLIDEQHLGWEEAWNITVKTLGYTNHTLMPEALEKWPVSIMEYVLPRHLQLIYEINHRFLTTVNSHWNSDLERLRRMSIIEEGDTKQVRMANLAIVGSHSVNGVAELHSELVKKSLVPDFYQLWPQKFNNKTNGVTQRRWLLKANPLLSNLISSTIGDGWITDLYKLRDLEKYANEAQFQEQFMQVKQQNKVILAELIHKTARVRVNPASLFDVHIKRMHEYKRQLLNVMHIIYEYLRFIEDGKEPMVARSYIFSGKAAPGYQAAKQIIKLINSVGAVVNHDKRVKDLIKVAFLPDYRVSLAEKIFPGSDLSEQISTAGTEASGTGNMKFMMNGAITMGTLDGANIEIKEEVSDENIFIFGLKSEEIEQMRRNGSYSPLEYYRKSEAIRRVMDAINSDLFCHSEPGIFTDIFDRIIKYGDVYFHLADLESYLNAHQKVGECYRHRDKWAKMAIMNVARCGKFSSDRTISEYARDIWDIKSY